MGRAEGKVAVVTGAAGGIGGAVARAFADARARVVGVDRASAMTSTSSATSPVRRTPSAL